MFTKNTWMSAGYIKQAITKLDFYTNSFNVDERDAALEGIAWLKDAEPEYLMNLIPQDHPDRIAAVRLLEQAAE